MITITKIFEFPAGHHLPYHEGACKNQHGHNFKLEITIGRKISDLFIKKGMVMDFSDLKKIVKEKVIDLLDHKYLNDIIPNPTAELLVIWIQGILDKEIKDIWLTRIRLWESSTSYAEWKA